MEHKYKTIIEWSEEDLCYIARCPELEGCVTHGETQIEAVQNLNEAVELYLESCALS